MDDEKNNYDDFKINPLKLEAAKYLLSQGKNDSEVAAALDLDRHTVSKIRNRMVLSVFFADEYVDRYVKRLSLEFFSCHIGSYTVEKHL